MMKKLIHILSAALLAVSMAGCNSKAIFSDEMTENGDLIVTADNADIKSAVATEYDIAEGDTVTVTSEVTKGGITFKMIRGGSSAETPAVSWEFTEAGTTDYQVDPGSYLVSFESTQKHTTGKITFHITHSETKAEDEGDTQNPTMNFVGTYAKDRCSILVEAQGQNNAKFTVMWGSSAAEHSEWTMSGKLDTETLTVDYTDCVKKDVVFKEDGTIDTETVIYENGTGTFKFDGSTLTWTDNNENAADGMVFEYAN